jgi:hypothetical protein
MKDDAYRGIISYVSLLWPTARDIDNDIVGACDSRETGHYTLATHVYAETQGTQKLVYVVKYSSIFCLEHETGAFFQRVEL